MTDARLFASLPTATFLTDLRTTHRTSPERRAAFAADAALAPDLRTHPLVVLDTNVLLDLWYWDDAVSRFLRTALFADRFWAVRSDDTVDELADVLRRRHFGLSVADQCEILRLWHTASVGVHLADDTQDAFCRDQDDVKFLTLAQALQADFLISKDKKVLKAGRKLRRLGVTTISPLDLGKLNLSVFTEVCDIAD